MGQSNSTNNKTQTNVERFDEVAVTGCLIQDTLLLESYVEFLDLLNLKSHVKSDLNKKSCGRSGYENVREALVAWKSGHKAASVGVLQRLLQEARFDLAAESLNGINSVNNDIQQPTVATKCFIGIPKVTARYICGRSEEVETLMKYYRKGGPTTVLVAAVGGQGKTTLAMAFVNQLKNVNRNLVVAWLNGSAVGPLTTSIHELCGYFMCSIVDDKGKPLSLIIALNKILDAIEKKMLKDCSTPQLVVILDNVDATYEELPAVMHSFAVREAFLLVTSRRADVVPYDCELLRLGSLDIEAAKNLIVGLLPAMLAADVQLLCKELDCYALGLRQSAAYIKYQQQQSLDGANYSVAKYITDLGDNIIRAGPSLLEYNSSTEAVLRMTLSQIGRSKDGATGIFLLRVLSLVNAEGIQVDYVKKIAVSCLEKVESADALRGLELLKRFALINCEGKVVTIHRIIQLVVKQFMTIEGQIQPLLTCFLETWKLEFHHTRENVQYFIKIYEESYEQETVVNNFVYLHTPIFNTLHELSLFLPLLNFTTKCWLTFKVLLGELHKETLRAHLLYNTALLNVGKYMEALEGMDQCYRNHLGSPDYGPLSVETYACLRNLGVSHRLVGNFEKSRNMLEEALLKLTEIEGESYSYTLNARNELAITQRDSNLFSESLENFQQVLKAEQKIYGPTSIQALESRRNIACLLCNTGKYESARKEFECIIDSMGGLSDNALALGAHRMLALCFVNQGQWKEAQELLTRILPFYTRVFGATHPNTHWIQTTLIKLGSPVSEGKRSSQSSVNHTSDL